MKFTRIFIGLITIVLITLAYSCERSKDSKVEREDSKVERGDSKGESDTAEVKSLAGTWKLTSSNGDSGPLYLRERGKNITGRFKGTNNRRPLNYAVTGTMSGDKISLEFSEYGSIEVAKFDGKVNGNKMSGKWVYGDQSGTWEAIK
jgi:hypothetical protein